MPMRRFDGAEVMALFEEQKSMPWSAVWDFYCATQGRAGWSRLAHQGAGLRGGHFEQAGVSMMSPSVEQSWFVQGMVKATTDCGSRVGMNATAAMSAFASRGGPCCPMRLVFEGERTVALGEALPELDGQVVPRHRFRQVLPQRRTRSGKQSGPDRGRVARGREVRVRGDTAMEAVRRRNCRAHLKSHRTRQAVTNGRDRVVMHCHATNLIALSYVLHPSTAAITRALWEMSTECLVVFPDGIAFLPWLVPGNRHHWRCDRDRNARAFAGALALSPASLGLARTWRIAFGLIDTAEKASEVLVKVLSMGGAPPLDHHAELAGSGGAVRGPSAGVSPRDRELDVAGGDRAMIRKAFLMTVNPTAHEEYKKRHDEIWTDLAVRPLGAWSAQLLDLPGPKAQPSVRLRRSRKGRAVGRHRDH